MGFRAVKTIDGEMAFCRACSSLLTFHKHSGNCLFEKSNGWELPGMELVGSRGSSPLGFMVIITLPSPKEEAANESSAEAKARAFIAFISIAVAEPVAVRWEQLGSRGWGSAEPQAGPLSCCLCSQRPSVLLLRRCLLSFL